jgi:AraC family transcriptional regulator
MTNIEYVIESINFIEKNLKNDISVFDVSKKIGYSLFHFSRLFQGITGFSPKAYILQRRLSESVNDLLNTKKKIIEIAFEYQFGSHEAYTRAFHNHFGIRPKEIRKQSALSSFPLLYPLTLEAIKNTQFIKDYKEETVELPAIFLAGFPLFVKDEDDGSLITELWGKFNKEVSNIPKRLIPEKYYQVQYWSQDQELNGLFFFIGVEVTAPDPLPLQFSLKNIPKAKYMHFIHKGLSRHVGYTYKYIYNQWLPKTEYKLNLPYNFEYYGDRYKGPDNDESESDIYIPLELL